MKKKKLFVVNKLIYATSAAEAIKIEKKFEVDEVFLDTDWKKNNPKDTESNRLIGFRSGR